MKVVVTAECKAPPEVVFATHLDIPNWPRFLSDIKKIDVLTGGPIAIGMRFRATRLQRGRRTSSELKLVAMDVPWRLTFSMLDVGQHHVVTSEMLPDGSGSRLTLSFETVPSTFAARLRGWFSFLSARGTRRQLQSDLAGLAREAERRIGR